MLENSTCTCTLTGAPVQPYLLEKYLISQSHGTWHCYICHTTVFTFDREWTKKKKKVSSEQQVSGWKMPCWCQRSEDRKATVTQKQKIKFLGADGRHACQLRTGNWSYSLHAEQQKTGKMLPVLMNLKHAWIPWMHPSLYQQFILLKVV